MLRRADFFGVLFADRRDHVRGDNAAFKVVDLVIKFVLIRIKVAPIFLCPAKFLFGKLSLISHVVNGDDRRGPINPRMLSNRVSVRGVFVGRQIFHQSWHETGLPVVAMHDVDRPTHSRDRL